MELDVVEVMLMAVEAVDGHRQVPAALRINLSRGVQHPLVARHSNVHTAGLTQEVYVERDELLGIDSVGGRHHADGKPVEVEALTGTHLHCQCRLHARHH